MPDIKTMIGTPVLLFAFTAVLMSGAQQEHLQRKTFQAKTELVDVRAVVTDRHGQVIEGLKKDDFEVLDNKRPQEIRFFSVVASVPATKQVPAGKVSAGEIPAPKPIREQLPEVPRRSVAIFVDNMHLSISSLMRVKQELHLFVDGQLTEQDAIALVPSAGTLGMAEQFTRDRLLLRYAIERLNVGWSLHDEDVFAPYLAAMIVRGDRDVPLIGRDGARAILAYASFRRNAAFVTLKNVVERMKDLPGQRLLVIFSDGFTLANDRGVDETGELQSIIGSAARSGVTIYSIYARGLQPPAGANAAIRPPKNPHWDFAMASAEMEAPAGINALAYNTGGDAYYTTNDLGGALAQALDRNRVYYSLAYYMPDPGDDRRLHRIAVRVKNHPEYVVRAPKYYQPAEATKPEAGPVPETRAQRLLQSINAPMPSTGIDVAATADFIEGEADNSQVSLTVHVGGDKFQYLEADDRYSFAFELSTVLYDSSGKSAGGLTDSVKGKLTPEQLALARKNGFQIVQRFALKPGAYQMRVGVLEPASEQMGTASSWVEVPDLARRKLALSSIILLDSPSPEENAGIVSRSKFVLGVRLFQREQPGAYAFRIYNAASGSAGPRLEMMTEFLQRGKMVKQTAWQELSSIRIAGDGKGIAVAERIKIGELAPGIYEMRITVRDLQSKQTDQRTVVFGIE
jgi:VWFA-related protein